MEIEEIKLLAPDFKKLVEAIQNENKTEVPWKTYLEQYDPEKHQVMDEAIRKKKKINTGTEKKPVEVYVDVNRLPVPFQKRIVNMSVAFLCQNPVQLIAPDTDGKKKDLLALIEKTCEDAKLDYLNKKIARTLFTETEVAELWYQESVSPEYWKGTPNEDAKFRLRMRILANSLGDRLYKCYNSVGDMVLFARGYKVSKDGKEVDHFDIYTADQIYLTQKEGDNWVNSKQTPDGVDAAAASSTVTALPNPFKKIPVIYYKRELPDWADVERLITRFETLISNLGDSNDYFGAPMVAVTGKVTGFADKGEQGKLIQMENGADAKYLTWDQAPESVRLERDTLRSLIMDFTGTIDLSIEQMKALGTYSGTALKLLFMTAHLKASDNEEEFGESVQRRLNFIKTAMITFNNTLEEATGMVVKPKFTYYLPSNEKEYLDMLIESVNAKIISKQTAVKKNPLVDNAEIEMNLINEEAKNPDNIGGE